MPTPEPKRIQTGKNKYRKVGNLEEFYGSDDFESVEYIIEESEIEGDDGGYDGEYIYLRVQVPMLILSIFNNIEMMPHLNPFLYEVQNEYETDDEEYYYEDVDYSRDLRDTRIH